MTQGLELYNSLNLKINLILNNNELHYRENAVIQRSSSLHLCKVFSVI